MSSRGQPRADTKLVPMTKDDLAQRRVRLEFVLHNASTKKVRNTAQALLVLQQEAEAAWDAAPADPAEAVRAVIVWPPMTPAMTTTGGFTDRHIEAVLAALGYESGDKPA